ncbi:DUF2231 domain-containing protein [Aureimonas psammosilenae]|uniref:DUF2231 domain-containing protein n=1 Tax=Aureimonas psammosilenae TaxID=2495496 RepID=UPI001260B3E5|nr:DUF2231 domain-containing protein [Aureimonas psammosilenae]
MTSKHPAAIVPVETHPVHATLASFPGVCFTLALLTDLAFWQTANLMWQNFSAWLLFAGLMFGALALVSGVFDHFRRRRHRVVDPSAAWLHGIGSLLILGLALLNSLVHAGDGWTAVVPYGLVLSAVTVVLLIVVAWTGYATISSGNVRRDV